MRRTMRPDVSSASARIGRRLGLRPRGVKWARSMIERDLEVTGRRTGTRLPQLAMRRAILRRVIEVAE